VGVARGKELQVTETNRLVQSRSQAVAVEMCGATGLSVWVGLAIAAAGSERALLTLPSRGLRLPAVRTHLSISGHGSGHGGRTGPFSSHDRPPVRHLGQDIPDAGYPERCDGRRIALAGAGQIGGERKRAERDAPAAHELSHVVLVLP
jgi:hypothetical protein